MTVKDVKVELTDYLGLKKEVNLEPGQIRQINFQLAGGEFTFKEFMGMFKATCRDYAGSYWVTGYINNHKICWIQCNQF